MEFTGDELAGVVDLFGGLTHDELSEALAELAYRQGESYDASAFEDPIDEAIKAYYLVAVDPDALEAAVTEPLLLAGPLAFPTLPTDARDLPHILDVETRTVSTEVVGPAVVEMFREDAMAAIEADDTERIDTLLDASYELEPWAGVTVEGIREELAGATQTN
jgi:hypothetical protein